jgi:hypothetical protein
MREFDRNPNWSKETLLEVSRKTGLSEAQVYKWGWDQKRKKYGPEAAALMMPPFESYMQDMPIGDSAEHILGDSADGYNNDLPSGLSEVGYFKVPHSNEEYKSSRLFGNPTPFPNETLLEQLSH